MRGGQSSWGHKAKELRRPGQGQSKGSPSAGAPSCHVSSCSRALLCLDGDLPPPVPIASCLAAAHGLGNLVGLLTGDHLAWNVLWLATPPALKGAAAC